MEGLSNLIFKRIIIVGIIIYLENCFDVKGFGKIKYLFCFFFWFVILNILRKSCF